MAWNGVTVAPILPHAQPDQAAMYAITEGKEIEMEPNVKYKIVSRHNQSTIDGYILNNRYYTETGAGPMPVGEIEDGVLTHRNTEGSPPLKVNGLTLTDIHGDVFDLVPE
ncbi:MAG TPA: hypothetical protein DEP32_13995 [Pseudomonas sp.]|nr:hypothetical protein [Pseudomonas sp.]MBB50240.1 hypothetical protein [Pseudomonadales bacterium]MBB50512.1 hypothetical protein [Pseudomonadales bacterium]MBO08024.1 hypothetical protein [Acidobacteriota bacterium]HCA25271.1 hypothetical protein [Pseudomonas sp.]|tara:strand:- start:36558 stop:36887 length:330 start_codon:yes stop_codon:yes gene_type:complete